MSLEELERKYDEVAKLWATAVKTREEVLVEVTERRMIVLDEELAKFEVIK